MINAVIFDWGGVITPDDRGGWVDVLASKLGITSEDLLPYWSKADYKDFSEGRIDEPEFWKRFQEFYGKPISISVREIVWTQGSSLTPSPVIMAFVGKLKGKGITVAVLSNTVLPMAELAYEARLYDPFDLVILSHEVGLAKPDVEIYKYTLEQLKTTAESCIFIDDRPKNLTPASELGIHTVLAGKNPNETIAAINAILNA